MFEQLNQHKDYELIEIGETDDWEFRILIAEAGMVENSAPVTSKEEPNEHLRGLMNKSTPVEVTDSSKEYEIIFPDYITYSVRNESYTAWNDQEEFEGNPVRVYTKSVFLEYVKNATFATSDYPGSFKHYGFCCLNHIVDIVSMDAPTIMVKNA